jgi:hypothetical protein
MVLLLSLVYSQVVVGTLVVHGLLTEYGTLCFVGLFHYHGTLTGKGLLSHCGSHRILGLLLGSTRVVPLQ